MKKICSVLILLAVSLSGTLFGQSDTTALKKEGVPVRGTHKRASWCDDTGNVFKMEGVQYTDVSGIDNDRPNGLLQYQALVKMPLVKKHWYWNEGLKFQVFRSIILDGTLNRIDKSKEEVEYDYTSFLIENNEVKKSDRPWLATTDLIRYSNLQLGAKLAFANLDLGDFRVYLDAGVQLIRNRPFYRDSIEVSPGVFEQRSDFRSVYSRANFIELFTKTLTADQKIDLSLTLGYRWIKLMDSYYQQITVLQQDPFQKITALQFAGSSPKRGMLYSSFRLGLAVGEEKTVSMFYRMNYSLETGSYLYALEKPVVGRPIRFEKRRFYNNFFQVHVGATISLEDLFVKDKDKGKKDGMIINSVN